MERNWLKLIKNESTEAVVTRSTLDASDPLEDMLGEWEPGDGQETISEQAESRVDEPIISELQCREQLEVELLRMQEKVRAMGFYVCEISNYSQKQ